MKHISSVSFAAAMLGFLGTQAAAGDLTIKVTDIRDTSGTLQLSVSSTDDAWNNKAPPVTGRKVPVTDKEMVLHITLPAGTYAVQVMHDANGNDKLDSNFMGIPTEGYGFSNNPTGLRKATFDEAKFTVGETPSSIVIRLR